MKYTRDQLEKLPRFKLRKILLELDVSIEVVTMMSTDDLINELLAKDACDLDCSHCDNIKATSLIDPGLRERLITRMMKQARQPISIQGPTMAYVAKKISEKQRGVIQAEQLVQMLEIIKHPKLGTSPFWRVDLEGEPNVTVTCVIDPLILEAANLTFRGLKSMMENEVNQLQPYLPEGYTFTVRIKKEIKQVLGFIQPRSREDR
jgi:hypothetical protein